MQAAAGSSRCKEKKPPRDAERVADCRKLQKNLMEEFRDEWRTDNSSFRNNKLTLIRMALLAREEC